MFPEGIQLNLTKVPVLLHILWSSFHLSCVCLSTQCILGQIILPNPVMLWLGKRTVSSMTLHRIHREFHKQMILSSKTKKNRTQEWIPNLIRTDQCYYISWFNYAHHSICYQSFPQITDSGVRLICVTSVMSVSETVLTELKTSFAASGDELMHGN